METSRLEALTGAQWSEKMKAMRPVAEEVFALARGAGREAAANGAMLAAVTIYHRAGVSEEHAVAYLRQLFALVRGARSGDMGAELERYAREVRREG